MVRKKRLRRQTEQNLDDRTLSYIEKFSFLQINQNLAILIEHKINNKLQWKNSHQNTLKVTKPLLKLDIVS